MVDYMKLSPHFFVHLFHVLFVGALFIYVGVRREKNPKFMYPLLLVLGVVVILYHLYKTYLKLQKGGYWVNLIHILLVGPLLLYIGVTKEKTSRKYYELLLLLAFATIGYHSYYMFQMH